MSADDDAKTTSKAQAEDGHDPREAEPAEGALEDDATDEGAPEDDATAEDATGEDATGEDATGEDAPEDDAPEDDATGEDATDEDATGEDATGEDATGEDATEDDAPEDDATGEEDAEDAEAEANIPRVKRPEDDYPEADEQTLRRAGVGCLVLTATLALAFYGLVNLAFEGLTGLDSADVQVPTSQPPEASQRRSEPNREGLAGVDPDLGPVQHEIAWLDSLGTATATAQSQHRPLLVYFESSSEPGSMRTREVIFDDVEIRALAADFVAVKVDLANADGAVRYAAQELEVTDLPCLLLLRADHTRITEDVTRIDGPSVKRALQTALTAINP